MRLFGKPVVVNPDLDSCAGDLVLGDWSLPTDIEGVRKALLSGQLQIMESDVCPPDEIWLTSPHGIVKLRFMP